MKRERLINSALLVAFCGSILLPLASLTARGATEEQINKKFSVKPGGTVVVDIDFGGIVVGTNATSEVEVDDLTGDVKSHTSGGGLHFARLHGPLNGETSGGGIHVVDCEGKLKIETSGGGIEVAGGEGSLVGDTSGGSVSVKKFHGPVHV